MPPWCGSDWPRRLQGRRPIRRRRDVPIPVHCICVIDPARDRLILNRGGLVRLVSTARAVVLACALVSVGVLTGCTTGQAGNPAVDSTAAISIAAEQAIAEQLAADQAAEVQAAAERAAVEQAAADKAIADKLAADQAAAQAAADQAAADKAAADKAAADLAVADLAAQAAAEQAAAQAAAEQAAAEEQAAEEQAAAEAAAEAAAAEKNSSLDGWYTPNGNWVSPETAARAIDAGIAPGETVPNYLRCGTICGEGPTSGEVQVAQACKAGEMTPAECAGVDPDAIIDAASGYAR